MPIICLYVHHYICINGRNHCSQGFTSLKESNKEGKPCFVKNKYKNNLFTTVEMVIKTPAGLTASDIINKELSMVNNWSQLNPLSLDFKKSTYVIFNTKKKQCSKFKTQNRQCHY